MIRESFVHYRQHLLHYVKAGNGKKPLLVFHGFGQDHTLYIPLLKQLSGDYTLYIVDLFFHGKSTWGDGERPLSKETWNNILQTIFQDEGISSFSILAYSLGGKFALATLEGFPNQVKEMFLVAPDGIHKNIWYSLATSSQLFRRFFRGMISNQNRFQKIAGKIDRLDIIDKSVIRFADYQMGTEEKRKRVYYSWVVFRHLTFNLKTIGKLINQHSIRLTVITGRHDHVIRPESMNALLRHVKKYKFEILDAGHSGLVREALRMVTPRA